MAVKGDLDPDWKNLGRLLGIDENKLRSIQMDNFGDTSNSLGDMLGQWMIGKAKTGALPRNWDTFINALYQAGHEQLAENLAEKHSITIINEWLPPSVLEYFTHLKLTTEYF